MPRTFTAPLISCLAALFLLMACATSKTPASRVGRYIVSVPKAAFYKYGPAQSFGPDLQLNQGQRLTKIDDGYGFSHVMTDDGTTGFVANEDIKPAPPELAAMAPAPSPIPGTIKGTGSKRSKLPPNRGLPALDVNDVPLPMPDNYEPPKATPRFRF